MTRTDIQSGAWEVYMTLGYAPFPPAFEAAVRYVETRASAETALAEREKVAAWMISTSLATGHGDTIEGLLVEASAQIAAIRARTAEAMRARCEAIARERNPKTGGNRSATRIADAIHALKGNGEGK